MSAMTLWSGPALATFEAAAEIPTIRPAAAAGMMTATLAEIANCCKSRR